MLTSLTRMLLRLITNARLARTEILGARSLADCLSIVTRGARIKRELVNHFDATTDVNSPS